MEYGNQNTSKTFKQSIVIYIDHVIYKFCMLLQFDAQHNAYKAKNIALVKSAVLVWTRPNLFLLSSYFDPAPHPYTKNSQKWPLSYWTFPLVCLSFLSVRGRGLPTPVGGNGGRG